MYGNNTERQREQYTDDVRMHVGEMDIPGTPSVGLARKIQGVGFPLWGGNRQVLDVRWAHGEPMNGVARSDDHISRFEVELPFEEIDHETVEEDVCIECGCHRAIYVYSATHFIYGYERVYCPECETEYHHEEWG